MSTRSLHGITGEEVRRVKPSSRAAQAVRCWPLAFPRLLEPLLGGHIEWHGEPSYFQPDPGSHPDSSPILKQRDTPPWRLKLSIEEVAEEDQALAEELNARLAWLETTLRNSLEELDVRSHVLEEARDCLT